MIQKKNIIIALLSCCLVTGGSIYGQSSGYASHSALSSGNWWKMAVADEGIYKLSASEIASLNGSSADQIALYGQPGGAFDEDNSVARPDDLEEIPIEVVDHNGNGLFDGDDYLLFYATGADRWLYNNGLQQYTNPANPYAKYNYVFVTLASGTHLRVEQVDNGAATGAALTAVRSTVKHEQELTNTHESGQIWVGEKLYGNNATQTITMTLPSAPTGKVRVRYALASISNSTASFSVDINGTTNIHTLGGSHPYGTYLDEASVGGTTVTFTIQYSSNEPLAAGYIDFIEVDAETAPIFTGSQQIMRLPAGEGGLHTITVANVGSTCRIWNVSNIHNIYSPTLTLGGNAASLVVPTDSEQTLVVFNGGYKTVGSISTVSNQDLHGTPNPDMVIVAHRDLLSQAQRLASLHTVKDNMEVLVCSDMAVYNEFSSGRQDPIAIREMLRMFKKRADMGNGNAPRYLLLFGKGCFDNRNITGHSLPTIVTWQSVSSFDSEGGSIASDDIFGYLDDDESGMTYESLEVGIGRLPAKDADEATLLVDKIEHYMYRSDLTDEGIRGDWRNSVALLADDADPSCPGDTNFTYSQEVTARQINLLYPQYNIDKIYADAYVQQSGADGSFYPDAKNALTKRINYGCLLLNYIGHGSSQYIGTERYMEKSDINNYHNLNQLPFFITSTCTFGKYDMSTETCGAEEFVLSNGAGIGCVSASRPIAHVQMVNTSIVLQALNPSNRMGDALRMAKNAIPATHALNLMGDPALRLSFPDYKVVVTKINGVAVDSNRNDSALVLSTVCIEGEIQDALGNVVEDFDGYIYPEVYDRTVSARTLANDNEGCEVYYTKQQNLLYKGRSTVSGGRFEYHFIIPRDVAYQFAPCKLSHYAKSASEDATGSYEKLYLGGFDESVSLTETRPEVTLYMNDTNFRNGGITDENPTLLVRLFDSIGINAVGSGLGHDITAIVDENPNGIIILNDFYETDISNEHYGSVRYALSGLAEGRHTISVKAWNIFNYSNSGTIVFYVHGSDTVTSCSFSAWPNPSSTSIAMRAEHNSPNGISSVCFEIYDIQGRLVRTLTPETATGSFVAGPVLWDLRGDGGQRVKPGIYPTRCVIITADGERLTERGKLVVAQ